jgi:hypothetical protein
MAIRLKVGDYFRIPLPGGRWAYCQHVNRNAELGFLIRVLDQITSEPLDSIANLQDVSFLFPPVFVGLQATARSGRWAIIGNGPVNNFEFPKFRQCMGTKPGTYYDWRIWDGKKTKKIGELPPALRSLELRQVWGDEGLEERIVAGSYRGDRMF